MEEFLDFLGEQPPYDTLELAELRRLGDRARLPVGRYVRPVVSCTPDTSIRAVAELIGQARQSCAVVRFSDGLGIVTDADFRHRVRAGQVPADAPVEAAGPAPRPRGRADHGDRAACPDHPAGARRAADGQVVDRGIPSPLVALTRWRSPEEGRND